MNRAEKVFQVVVMGGIALATAGTTAGCPGDGPREGADAQAPRDAAVPPEDTIREGLDASPPVDAPFEVPDVREGVDVGPPVDAAASDDDAATEDAP